MPDHDDRAHKLEEANKALETRLQEMEKTLAAERERAVNSVSVENALKDMQDKLRREKREQELDALRQAAEGKARDLERRLSEERDMWVTMMKEHLARGGDTKPLLGEIAALKTEMGAKDEQIAALKEQSLKGGGDQKVLQKEISSLKDILAAQESQAEAGRDEVKRLKETLAAKDVDAGRLRQELNLQTHSLQQSLAEKEAETHELMRQVETLRQDAERAASSIDLTKERESFQTQMKEREEFQARMALRIQELEKEVGQRDALIQAVRAENAELQKKTAQMSAAKDAETQLMRENLQRLGRQNKELLEKLREAVDASPAPNPHDPGPVAPDMQDMLSSLEDALTNRDKMLEDQQKSIDEKRGLIDGLFNDLKSLDEQAVALLEEKNRQSQEMNERMTSLTTENERLKRLLESRPAAPPEAPPPA